MVRPYEIPKFTSYEIPMEITIFSLLTYVKITFSIKSPPFSMAVWKTLNISH